MKFAYSAFCAISFLGLASCGGGVGPTAASGSVTKAQAIAMQSKLDDMVTAMGANITSAPTMGSEGGVTASSVANGLSAQSLDFYGGCRTITPNPTVDADGDHIAKEKNYTYNCTDIIGESNNKFSQYGTAEIRDLNDNVKTEDGGGYSYKYDMRMEDEDNKRDWKGEFSLVATSTSWDYTSVFRFHNYQIQSNVPDDYTWESNYKSSYKFDDIQKPWDKGRMKVEGFYRVKMYKIINGQTIDTDVTFHVRNQDVAYEKTPNSSGCTRYFYDGKMIFTDGAGNTIQYVFHCTSTDYFFNGEKIKTF